MIFPKYFAIDYGTQRVGVAVSYGTLAEPLQVVVNDDKLMQTLVTLIKENGAQEVVIGLSENEMAEKTRAFATELEKIIDLPIHFMDETLSSAAVHQKLAEKYAHKQHYTGPIDHFAAAEILQEYIDGIALAK